jgi:hypothetical protein
MSSQSSQPYEVLEADVESLLRPDVEYDDLVAFVWEPGFEITVVLAKVLGIMPIREYKRT